MARRSVEWNQGLAKDLKNTKFAAQFIQSSLEEGISLQAVLAKIVRSYGVSEFAKKIGMPASNVLRTVNPKHNPTIDTLNRFLKPFGLELSVSRTTKGRAA